MNFDDEQAMRVEAHRAADEYVQAMSDCDVLLQVAVDIDATEVNAILSPGFKVGVGRVLNSEDGDDELRLASIVALVLARRKMVTATATMAAEAFSIDREQRAG